HFRPTGAHELMMQIPLIFRQPGKIPTTQARSASVQPSRDTTQARSASEGPGSENALHSAQSPGRISDLLVSNYDFLPTVLSYLGLADRMPTKPRSPGRDFSRAIRGESI